MNSETIRTQLRRFISETFLLGASAQTLRDTDSLVATEIIDSTGFLELIGFVEERFGVQVDDTDMVEANFETITAISRFVQRKSALAV